ncbi:uncharacterized protein LOC142339759 isoform X2 [Convolutriloba macropyga]|uniref:uncharacterized protein LOC142339759 isoform X2 n=1 Tax=Convolutriloba macropyga TaxID=536237 RepID=UPI003F51B213
MDLSSKHNKWLPQLYEQSGLAHPGLPPVSSAANPLLNPNPNTQSLTPRPFLGAAAQPLPHPFASGANPLGALTSSHPGGLPVMDLTPSGAQRSGLAGLGQQNAIQGAANGSPNALAAMAAAANLNPSAAAAMLFSPMLLQQQQQQQTQNNQTQTQGTPNNGNPQHSVAGMLPGGTPQGISTAADDRVKLAALHNHIFYLQHQHRQQQINFLNAQANNAAVALDKQQNDAQQEQKVSPNLLKSPDSQNGNENSTLDRAKHLETLKTSPLGSTQNLKRSLETSHSTDETHDFDNDMSPNRPGMNKEAKLSCRTSPTSAKVGKSAGDDRRNSHSSSPSADVSSSATCATQQPLITSSTTTNKQVTVSMECSSLPQSKVESGLGKICPVCKEQVDPAHLMAHLIEEFKKFEDNMLKLRHKSQNTLNGGGSQLICQERLETLARIRAARQERISGLSSKLRHNKNPFPSMVGVESKNSTQNNHLSMGGKLSPLELTQMCPSSSGGSPSPFNGAKEGHSLGSPLSPSSVIRSSLDHFDKFTNITTANNTANKSNSEKDLSPNSNNRRLLLIDSILNNESTISKLTNSFENRVGLLKSETSPIIPSPTGSVQEKYSHDSDVTDVSFKRLTSSANEIQVR